MNFQSDQVENSKNFVVGLACCSLCVYLMVARPLLLPVGVLCGVSPKSLSAASGVDPGASFTAPGSLIPDATLAAVISIAYTFICGVGAVVSIVYGQLWILAGAVVNRVIGSTKTQVDDAALANIKKTIEAIAASLNQLWDKVEPPPPPEPSVEEQLKSVTAELQKLREEQVKKTTVLNGGSRNG